MIVNYWQWFFLFYYLLFIGPPKVYSTANNSLSDCQRVASAFRSTINYTAANITATTGINVTCPATGIVCPGQNITGGCIWQRKLSAICRNASGIIKIRIQTNGLPPRCANVPMGSFVELNVDFEVNFNPDVNINSPNYNLNDTSSLSQTICTLTNPSVVPLASNFVNYGATNLDTATGVSVDGVMIFSPDSANNVDPFYPPPSSPAESVDSCLAHCQVNGVYHYHIGSGCMLDPPIGPIAPCANNDCGTNIANYSISSFYNHQTLTTIGIAKDGHVIYGPYLSTNTRVTSGFDVCNGMFYDTTGNYAYFATSTFPYLVGCFGPGNYPSVGPTCTMNGVSSYTMSSYAMLFISNSTTPAIWSSMKPLSNYSMTASPFSTQMPQLNISVMSPSNVTMIPPSNVSMMLPSMPPSNVTMMPPLSSMPPPSMPPSNVSMISPSSPMPPSNVTMIPPSSMPPSNISMIPPSTPTPMPPSNLTMMPPSNVSMISPSSPMPPSNVTMMPPSNASMMPPSMSPSNVSMIPPSSPTPMLPSNASMMPPSSPTPMSTSNVSMMPSSSSTRMPSSSLASMPSSSSTLTPSVSPVPMPSSSPAPMPSSTSTPITASSSTSMYRSSSSILPLSSSTSMASSTSSSFSSSIPSSSSTLRSSSSSPPTTSSMLPSSSSTTKNILNTTMISSSSMLPTNWTTTSAHANSIRLCFSNVTLLFFIIIFMF
ncbi:unnamed protein product [Adineta steineri]|uniref:YHYH domain-containing protein n=1 Tax=Adineta steineri TaxID=433720 RepID=A0A815KRG0_9BILA|nr:unnamed protein product [Adineta steineri]